MLILRTRSAVVFKPQIILIHSFRLNRQKLSLHVFNLRQRCLATFSLDPLIVIFLMLTKENYFETSIKVMLHGCCYCWRFLVVIQKLATFCRNKKIAKVVIARHVTRDNFPRNKLLLRVFPCTISLKEHHLWIGFTFEQLNLFIFWWSFLHFGAVLIKQLFYSDFLDMRLL